MAKEEDFKIVDKRSSAGIPEDTKPAAKEESKQGEGFVMKEGAEQGPMQIDFSTFIFSLATGALINMGLAPDPQTNKVTKSLSLAKQNIDLLAMLQDKTKNNLTADEKQLMDSLLHEIRLRFVDVSKK